MNEDYRDVLHKLAERGRPRGVEQLLADARTVQYVEQPRHYRRLVATGLSAAVVIAAAGLALRVQTEDSRQAARHEDSCIVFVRTDAAPGELSAIERALRSHPQVVGLVYLDEEAARAELAELFPDTGQIEAADETELPTSFRFQLRNVTSSEEISSSFDQHAGVDAVACGVTLDARGYRERRSGPPPNSIESDGSTSTTLTR